MVNYLPLNQRYISNLHGSQRGLRYLTDRGLTIDTIEKFELGLAMTDGQEIASKVVEEAGLLYQRDNGSIGSFFNNRIMIPIRNVDGVIAGYTGRTLLKFDGIAKYKNSKESKQFDKSSILYNLHSIGDNSSIVLFEGHLNVLAFDQAIKNEFGKFPHPVAKGGTALTQKHVQSLKEKGVKSVFLCNDGDKAGREAVLKDIALLKNDFLVWVVTMPKGKDAMDFIYEPSRLVELVIFDSVLHDEYVSSLIDTYKHVKKHRIANRIRTSDVSYERAILQLDELLS